MRTTWCPEGRDAASGPLLAAVVAVALVVRLGHVAAVAGFEATHVVIGLDRWLETEIAAAVADGNLLGGPLAAYESAPAYAIALGLLLRLTGGSWLAALVVQAVLGALAPLLLYVAGRRLAGPHVGLLAAALAGVYAPAVFYEGLTIKFSLVPVTVSALLAATAAALTQSRFHLSAAVAGVATAALVALRPNAIVVLPIVVAWIAWTNRPARAAPALLLFALGLCAIAAPLAVYRNLAAARGEVASLSGILFYVGSQPEGDGGYTSVPGIADDVFGHVDDARALAEASLGRPLSPPDVSAYWFRRGVEQIRQHPAGYAKLLGRKLRRLVAPGEEDAFGDDFAVYAERSPVLRWGPGFGTLAPLALLGLVLVVAGRSPLAWCAGLVVAYVLSLLFFFVTSRYRLPLVPPLLLCAGFALAWLAELRRARRRAALVGALGLLAAVAIALGTPGADLVRLLAVLAVGVPALRDQGPT